MQAESRQDAFLMSVWDRTFGIRFLCARRNSAQSQHFKGPNIHEDRKWQNDSKSFCREPCALGLQGLFLLHVAHLLLAVKVEMIYWM